MINNKNMPKVLSGNKVKIGRMKGDISVGYKIYKMSDKQLTSSALETINKENRKVNLNCKLTVKKDLPIELTVFDNSGITVKVVSNITPEPALNSPISKDRLIAQITKTNNTPFQFENIEIDLEDGLFIKGISCINELRRNALSQYEEKLISSFRRNIDNINFKYNYSSINHSTFKTKKVSVLLNLINKNFDYTNLQNVDNIYIPFKFFVLKDLAPIIQKISEKFNTYIYMPTIIRNNYTNLINNNLPNILKNYNIKGFVLSNIGNFELLKQYQSKYDFFCNYTFNIFNNLTINELTCNTVTLSPELNDTDLSNILAFDQDTNSIPKKELIVYGRIPLMNSNYCLLGKTNKCYPSCTHQCNSSNKFYLKDRFGFVFRVIPDNVETVTTIYNNRLTSIPYKNVNVDSVRFDVLDETIEEINSIINKLG